MGFRELMAIFRPQFQNINESLQAFLCLKYPKSRSCVGYSVFANGYFDRMLSAIATRMVEDLRLGMTAPNLLNMDDQVHPTSPDPSQTVSAAAVRSSPRNETEERLPTIAEESTEETTAVGVLPNQLNATRVAPPENGSNSDPPEIVEVAGRISQTPEGQDYFQRLLPVYPKTREMNDTNTSQQQSDDSPSLPWATLCELAQASFQNVGIER